MKSRVAGALEDAHILERVELFDLTGRRIGALWRCVCGACIVDLEQPARALEPAEAVSHLQRVARQLAR